jgi:hypothetical protein
MALPRRLTIDEQFVRIGTLVASYRPPEHQETSVYYIPESQREWSWKAHKQALFIDSIMLNYPIPSVICNCDEHGRYAIYDGRHRVETLWRFFNNKVIWSDGQQGRFFEDLGDVDRERFLERKLCVIMTHRATETELGDIFERLNSGVRLTDSDLFWNRRTTPLVNLTISRFIRSTELSALWGDTNLSDRKHLANYVGIVAGLATCDSNNFTSSYIRLGGSRLMLSSVDYAEAESRVDDGIQALIDLYSLANAEFPVATKNNLKPYKKLGVINAFFLADWMTAGTDDDAKYGTILKWARIIGLLRDLHTASDAKSAMATKGAQNLTTAKIEKVHSQINKYLVDLDAGISPNNIPELDNDAFDDDDSVDSA